jgi:phosphoribosylglycinamide formyltransferase-1
MKKVVILISGRGSNMQAIVNANLSVQIAAVISNEPAAAGLDFAKSKGIMTAVVRHKDFATREAFDTALSETIDAFQPDLVLLAGFMRILTPLFVQHYAGRLMNIHPSLLPAFPGLHTHQQALDAGVKLAGCTVHFVTAALDHGPIIAQVAVPVLENDTADTLAARILQEEHNIYPQAVAWFAEDRLVIEGNKVRYIEPLTDGVHLLRSVSN